MNALDDARDQFMQYQVSFFFVFRLSSFNFSAPAKHEMTFEHELLSEKGMSYLQKINISIFISSYRNDLEMAMKCAHLNTV